MVAATAAAAAAAAVVAAGTGNGKRLQRLRKAPPMCTVEVAGERRRNPLALRLRTYRTCSSVSIGTRASGAGCGIEDVLQKNGFQ
jgi:hypothetical protein